MLLKFVPQGPINTIAALVQIMARRRSGNKSFSEPMMAYFNVAYMRRLASMSWCSPGVGVTKQISSVSLFS